MKRLLLSILAGAYLLFFLLLATYEMQKDWSGIFSYDLRSQYLPFLIFAKQSVFSGTFPSWTPYQAIGQPFFAQSHAGLLYPVNWIVLFLDTLPAMLVIQLLNILIGITGMFLYSRHLKLGWPAVVLTVSLFAIATMGVSFQLSTCATYAWIPLIFYSIHRLFEKPSFKRCATLAAFLSLSFLGGFTQYFYYVCIIAFSYSLFLSMFSTPNFSLRGSVLRTGLVALAFALTAGLVSLQLLPSLELSFASVRNAAEKLDPRMSLLWAQFDVLGIGMYWRGTLNQFGKHYFGISLFLVPFGLASRKYRPAVVALLLTFGLTLLFIFSNQLPAMNMISGIPFVNAFRDHVRILPFAEFIIILLAGIGVSSFWQKPPFRLRDSATGRLDLFWIPLAAYFFLLLCSSFSSGKLFTASAIFAVLLSCLIIILSRCAPSLSQSQSNITIWIIVALVLADTSIPVFLRGHGEIGLDTSETLLKGSVQWIKENAGYDRTLLNLPNFGVNPNAGDTFQFHSINSCTPFTLSRWSKYVSLMVGAERFDRINSVWGFYGIIDELRRPFLQQAQLAGLASLRYFVTQFPFQENDIVEEYSDDWRLIYKSESSKQFQVYENVHALPRAYLVTDYVITRNEAESLQAITRSISDMSHLVILEKGAPSFPASNASTDPGKVKIVKYGINRVDLDVAAAVPSLLVLTDSYFSGWNAFVDNEKAPIWRANSLFRAIEVPAGEHRVVFSYQPASLFWGAIVSSLSLLFLLGGVCGEIYQKRKKSSVPLSKLSSHSLTLSN